MIAGVKCFFGVCLLWIALSSGIAREEVGLEIPVMPLSDIVPGMQGIWKTVVSGTEIENFKLRIIGVADNFIGPKQSLILAEALDASQILSGPVAGMSGSPVYIDGKLIGAYSYGFLWPKEQAIIGITPIESMFAILAADAGGVQEASVRPGPVWSRPDWLPTSNTALHAGTKASDLQRSNQAHQWAMRTPHEMLPDVELNSALKAVPTPLFVAGISAQTLALFGDKFRALDVEVMQAPIGTAKSLNELSLEPGAAVAGVLMDGDFSFARVGTVTWRQNDTLLAFGHAMDRAGGVQLPMAPAEVITVVRSLNSSFKLSNVGKPVGVIYQDRLAGIMGKVGRAAPITPLEISLHLPTGAVRVYRGNVAFDRLMTPLITAIAVLESLTATLDAEFEQTFFVDMRIAIGGRDDLVMSEVISGQSAALQLVLGLMEIYDVLLNNPFAVADVTSIDVAVQVKSDWRRSSLQAVERLSGPAEGGGTLRLAVTLDHFRADPTRQVITVPLPETMQQRDLQVLIADASVADAYDLGSTGMASIESLDGIIQYYNRKRSSQKLYVKLLQSSEGIRIHDTDLYDLPPSVRKLMQSPRSVRAKQSKVKWKTIWESEIDVRSPVSGSYLMAVMLE